MKSTLLAVVATCLLVACESAEQQQERERREAVEEQAYQRGAAAVEAMAHGPRIISAKQEAQVAESQIDTWKFVAHGKIRTNVVSVTHFFLISGGGTCDVPLGVYASTKVGDQVGCEGGWR